MHTRLKEVIKIGDGLFSDRQSLNSFWQEVALNFYVEMADFTMKRDRGEDYADHLTSSYPLLARRTLGDSLGSLLRPVSLDSIAPGVWFMMRAKSESVIDDLDAERWLDWATGVMRRAMYDREAGFVRATKEGDHSFATFGQCPITVDLNDRRDTLLYQHWHLRDCVWSEGPNGMINKVHRNWTPASNVLASTFKNRRGATLHDNVTKNLSEDPFKPVRCRNIVMPLSEYEDGRALERLQSEQAGYQRVREDGFVEVWVDIDNDHEIWRRVKNRLGYIIPRWVTIPGSQYSSSPAVTVALPDARLVQSMMLTLLEAGEKHADPPMAAVAEAVRSDINLYAGGVTYVDAEYDERLGEALRPVVKPTAGEGMRYAVELMQQVQMHIDKAFFLDSLSMPPADVRDMTAFEVGQRISEWIRRAMPIFEPMEFEYNGPLCEETFELLAENGGFGDPRNRPDVLKSSEEIEFKFESPLHESSERRKGQKFLEAKAALVEAAELDPGAAGALKAVDALRDVLEGIGIPPAWRASEEELEQYMAEQQQRQAAQEAMVGAQQGGEAAQNLTGAVKNLAEAQGAVPAGGAV